MHALKTGLKANKLKKKTKSNRVDLSLQLFNGILRTCAKDVHERLKQTEQRLKLLERLLTINKRNIIR